MKNLKKKISVFALLLSFLLALVPPAPAAAADSSMIYVDIEDFLTSNGYESFDKNDDCTYFAHIIDDYLYVFEFDVLSDYIVFGRNPSVVKQVYALCDYSDIGEKYYQYYNPEKAASTNFYGIVSEKSGAVSGKITSMQILYKSTTLKNIWVMDKVTNVVYSDVDLCSISRLSSSAPYEVNYDDVYFYSNSSSIFNFITWCKCAGLNFTSSSNESPTVIPYSFNSYWHIVRRNSSGLWLLTTIGNSVMSENIDDYKLILSDTGNLQVYSIYGDDDVNGYKLNVRQYVYDTDGWKVLSYKTYDTRDSSGFVDLGAGSGFDDTRQLAFNNVDIYVGTEYEPVYPKSTEYYEVSITPPTVEPEEPDSPTPIPTTSPGSGSEPSGGGSGGGTRPESPDIGGDVEPGGGLDFIINLFTMIWTKICSVPMAVDGYSISLQQIIIYGALVSIVGGFIMHFIFGRK